MPFLSGFELYSRWVSLLHGRLSHAEVGPFCGANAVASFLSYFSSRKSGISLLFFSYFSLLNLKHSRQFKCLINEWLNILLLLLLLFVLCLLITQTYGGPEGSHMQIKTVAAN